MAGYAASAPRRRALKLVVAYFAVVFAGCRSSQPDADPAVDSLREAPYQLYVMVSAPKLDFRSAQTLIRSMAKNARGGGDRTIGHAWIRLVGPDRQLECGHTGQEDIEVESYERGMLRRLEAGEPNPVAYLWTELNDGSMQIGDGGHFPTLTAGRELTRCEYERALEYLDRYDFRCYSLHAAQCITLVTGVLAEIGLAVDAVQSIPVAKEQRLGTKLCQFWSDPSYSTLDIPTPQRLQTRLREAIDRGELVEVRRHEE